MFDMKDIIIMDSDFENKDKILLSISNIEKANKFVLKNINDYLINIINKTNNLFDIITSINNINYIFNMISEMYFIILEGIKTYNFIHIDLSSSKTYIYDDIEILIPYITHNKFDIKDNNKRNVFLSLTVLNSIESILNLIHSFNAKKSTYPKDISTRKG